jgi:hypothetical protein
MIDQEKKIFVLFTCCAFTYNYFYAPTKQREIFIACWRFHSKKRRNDIHTVLYTIYLTIVKLILVFC